MVEWKLDDVFFPYSPGFQLFGGGLGLHEVTIDFVEHVQSFSCLVQCGFCHELWQIHIFTTHPYPSKLFQTGIWPRTHGCVFFSDHKLQSQTWCFPTFALDFHGAFCHDTPQTVVIVVRVSHGSNTMAKHANMSFSWLAKIESELHWTDELATGRKWAIIPNLLVYIPIKLAISWGTHVRHTLFCHYSWVESTCLS